MPIVNRFNFGARIVIAFLAILLLLQIATFVIVNVAVDHAVHQQLAERIDRGVRVWRQVQADRGSRLQQAVSALASDFAFREALATGDASTVLSALANHSQRIDAKAALLLGIDGTLQISTLDGNESEQARAIAPLLDAARRNDGSAGVVVLRSKPYEMAIVPVMAPRLIGWVAMGRPLGHDEVSQYRSLTGLDAVLATDASSGGRISATTLSRSDTDALTQALGRIGHNVRPVMLGTQRFYTAAVPIDSSRSKGVEVLLLGGIDAARARYQLLRRQILILATLATALALLVAVLVGRGVSRPVERLAKAARRIEDGDYTQPLPVRGTDELSMLAGAFNRMQYGIGDREARIRHQASHDNLTGLPNRVQALSALQGILARAHANGRHCAVLMLDLDHFKEINDTLGHAFGDGVLKVVAERLRKTIRSEDLLARLGGDEFLLLIDSANSEMARQRAWALVQALEEPLHLPDHQAQVTLNASIGIALYPAHADAAEVLLRRADIAMYEAKQTLARVVEYRTGQDEVHLRQIRLVGDLRNALASDQFHLVFQPKIELASGRVKHVEALLRWRHPELGMIPPDEFIPLAEHCGVIHEITHFVLGESLRQAAGWRADGIGVGLAINLSAMDVIDPRLPKAVSEQLSRHDFPAGELVLEITESTVMRDLQSALRTMHALRGMGIHLSIDDFGTGHSSLAQLRGLPVDEIKIDKSFVMHLEQNPDDAVIVRSAIEIGHNMGLSVIAEGVEQPASLEILRSLKCDMVQGYLFSKPVPALQFRQWYADFRRKQRTNAVEFDEIA